MTNDQLVVSIEELQVYLNTPDRGALTPRVSISLGRGEVMGVMGANGSGKSVLTRQMLGVLSPPSAFVVSGVVLLKPGIHIGYSPQKDGLLPWRRIESNLRLPEQVNGLAAGDEHERLIEVFNMDAHRAKFPQELSGGYRVRAAICRAMATSPDLLVFDEPSRELDGEATCALIGEIEKAKSSGTAVWLISHEASLVEQTADLCLILGQVEKRPLIVRRSDDPTAWSEELLAKGLAAAMI